MPLNTAQLFADLTHASREGEAVGLMACDHSGSCNFDSLQLDLAAARLGPSGRKALERALCDLGFQAYFDRARLIVSPPSVGQAGARTAAARHMAELMGARGWSASVHYVTD